MGGVTKLQENIKMIYLGEKIQCYKKCYLPEISGRKKPDDQFESVIFLPEGEGRQSEGGLRTQGYFKTSLEGKSLITVVTMLFNGEKFLEETIHSVIN